jgi:hypothetical protein
LALPWGFVSKITNSKHQKTNKLITTSTKLQINHKFQVSHQKDGGQANAKQGLKLFFILLFVICFFGSACGGLFVFCYLGFPLLVIV